mmetsp:Transcript_48000/g.88354  ORF Transcript_48000/g.88354 Transcript_48000/m.88354 type:complete len:344 (+) Transcript_48000:64-1095(+)
MTAQQPQIRVAAGFCVQTESIGSGVGARWYINMCKHKLVGMPVAHSGASVTKEWILSHGIGNVQVPFDIGTCRKLKARADGAKQTTYVVDAVFNPFIVQQFTDDEFCALVEHYRQWVMNLVLKRIEESIGVKLSMPKVKLVKGVKYKDGHGAGGDVPRDFTELAGDLDVEETENTPPPPPTLNTSVPAESGKPIIEELPEPGQKKKQAVKKGFLNRNDKPLYGPEGSKEGVLPENAGDPMGWMPKGLRQKSKIVDCNSPEHQAHQKQVEAAKESNRVNQEFKDLIDSDLFAATKRDKHSMWSEDRPESVEETIKALPEKSEPRPNKYDLDYSRFEKMSLDELD